jgi:XisI protein
MAGVTFYDKLVQDIVREYGDCKPSYGSVELETIIDPTQGHYQLMTVGWDGQRRVHGCLLHVDVKKGKIWIQHDGTEEGIANRLVDRGVPKNDIVLAFHSPFKRRFTEFAVG